MSIRKRQDAYVHPVGHRPFKKPAELRYASQAELCAQLKQYARGVWTSAARIDVDPRSQEILIDGEVAARYALHEPRQVEDTTGSLL